MHVEMDTKDWDEFEIWLLEQFIIEAYRVIKKHKERRQFWESLGLDYVSSQ